MATDLEEGDFTSKQISATLIAEKCNDATMNDFLSRCRKLARYVVTEYNPTTKAQERISLRLTTGNAKKGRRTEQLNDFLQANTYISLINDDKYLTPLICDQIVKQFMEWIDTYKLNVVDYIVNLNDSRTAVQPTQLNQQTNQQTQNSQQVLTQSNQQFQNHNSQNSQNFQQNSQNFNTNQNSTSLNSQQTNQISQLNTALNPNLLQNSQEIQNTQNFNSQHIPATTQIPNLNMFPNFDILQKLNKLDKIDDIVKYLDKTKYIVERKTEIVAVLDNFTEVAETGENNTNRIEHLEAKLKEIETNQLKSIDFYSAFFRSQSVEAAARRRTTISNGSIRVVIETKDDEYTVKKTDEFWPKDQKLEQMLELNFGKIYINDKYPGKKKPSGDWLRAPVMCLQVNYNQASKTNTPSHKVAENLVFVKSKTLRATLQIGWDINLVDRKIAESTFVDWKKRGIIFGFKVNRRAKYIIWTEPALVAGDPGIRQHVTVSCPQNLVQLEKPTLQLIMEACQPDRAVYEGKIVVIKPPPVIRTD